MIQLVGLLLPPLIDLISYLSSKISDSFIGSQFRFWVSFIVCAIIGLGIDYYVTGGIGWGSQDEIAMSVLAVFGASQVSYHAVWEKTKAHEDLGTSN